MKILAIIPARGGSKGVPGKNIKLLGGKPLLAYTIEAAIEAKKIAKIMLSTDSEAILSCAKNYAIDIPFIRPSHLATDEAKSIDVVKHAVVYLEQQGEFFDAMILLQVTSPFREAGFIDAAIDKFVQSGADTLVSVLPVPHEYNPHWTFEPDANDFLKIATGETDIIARRQELPSAYHRDGAIYIATIDTIKKGSFYGEKITYIESNPNHYVNIDTVKDWEIAEQMINSK